MRQRISSEIFKDSKTHGVVMDMCLCAWLYTNCPHAFEQYRRLLNASTQRVDSLELSRKYSRCHKCISFKKADDN
jgi:hypothetical protein